MRLRLLDRTVHWVTGATMGAMTSIVFVSIVFRYVVDRPLSWSEELASLLFAWVTFLGAYVGFRTRSHIAIDTLVTFLPAGLRAGIARGVDLLTLGVLGLFVWQGIALCRATWSLEFPALEISRGYLYLALPVGALLMIVATLTAWWAGPSGPGEERP